MPFTFWSLSFGSASGRIIGATPPLPPHVAGGDPVSLFPPTKIPVPTLTQRGVKDWREARKATRKEAWGQAGSSTAEEERGEESEGREVTEEGSRMKEEERVKTMDERGGRPKGREASLVIEVTKKANGSRDQPSRYFILFQSHPSTLVPP